MLFVDNQNITKPQTNLAIEEYLLRQNQIEEPLLLFYVNEPSVIVGRNQNTIEEIDQDYIEANGIHVVRRLSGGGAVYHDLGNLNYSFITNGRSQLHNFAAFLQPVIDTLNGLGVNAEMGGNSDIVLDGKKLSGNAQYSTPLRMFNHGTLLFDTDVTEMLKSLNPRQLKIESKAVQSVRSAVTNIRSVVPKGVTIETFKTKLLQGIFGQNEIPQYELSSSDWNNIQQLREERYANWEWNVGRSPNYNVQKSGQLPFGKVNAHINVERGQIENLKLFGNFFGAKPVAELEKLLIGVRYERPYLESTLSECDVSQFIVGYSISDFIELLVG